MEIKREDLPRQVREELFFFLKEGSLVDLYSNVNGE